MSRHFSTPTIVLRKTPYGDLHRNLVLLSPERGLIEATAYGISKTRGRLAGATEPFCRAISWFYREEGKDRTKITDTEVVRTHEALRSDLRRLYPALLMSEVILKAVHGTEDAASVFRLLDACLDGLEDASAEHAPLFTVCFLWNFLEISGGQPELNVCFSCGRIASERNSVRLSLSDNAVLCDTCRSQGGGGERNVLVTAGARRWLHRLSAVEIGDAGSESAGSELRARLEAEAPESAVLENAREVLFRAAETYLDMSLATIEAAKEYL